MGENLPWQNVAISVWGGPAIRFTLERRSPPVVSPVKLPLEQGFRRKAFVTLLPFLKWPGGKRWLIARHSAAHSLQLESSFLRSLNRRAQRLSDE